MNWALHHGDCVEQLRAMTDDSVDVCVTDPPYEAECHTKARRSLKDATSRKGARNTGEVRHIAEPLEINFVAMDEGTRHAVAGELARIVTGYTLAFCQAEGLHPWRVAFEAAGLEWIRAGVWLKPDGAPQFTGDRPGVGYECIAIVHRKGRKKWNGGGRRAVWEATSARHEEGGNVHPTQKPIALMLDLVGLFSDPGDTVLDPFAGSGTTGVAALRLGRRFVGMERHPEYFATARDRLTAEEAGISLSAARSGQVPMFGGAR